jgi:hypothetical protein
MDGVRVVPDPASHRLDSFKCHKTRPSAGSPRPRALELAIGDEFNGGRKLRLGRPRHVCTPVSVDGAVVKNPARHLVCHRAAPAPHEPRHVALSQVFTASGIGEATVRTKREAEVCLAATVEEG